MAYFTHCQLKFSFENWRKIFLSFCQPSQIKALKKALGFYYPEKQIILTDMGRTAFRIILEKMDLREAEIIMPSYICDIFYPILEEFKIKPIFIDADPSTFNLKIEEIEEKITPETKAIVVCHTYGLPMSMEKISQIAKKRKIKVIEDIAHAIGGKYQGEYLGNFGDVAFASLYKQLPCSRGGLAIVPNSWQVDLQKTHFNFRDFVSLLNSFQFFSFILKKFFQKTAPTFQRKEKRSSFSSLNRVSVNLARNFLPGLEKNLQIRSEQAKYLSARLEKMDFSGQPALNNSFTFLSLLLPENLILERNQLVKKAQKKGVFLTRIWHTPIVSNPCAQKIYEIDLSLFPNTDKISRAIINVPLQNHFSTQDCEKILAKIRQALNQSIPS